MTSSKIKETMTHILRLRHLSGGSEHPEVGTMYSLLGPQVSSIDRLGALEVARTHETLSRKHRFPQSPWLPCRVVPRAGNLSPLHALNAIKRGPRKRQNSGHTHVRLVVASPNPVHDVIVSIPSIVPHPLQVVSEEYMGHKILPFHLLVTMKLGAVWGYPRGL